MKDNIIMSNLRSDNNWSTYNQHGKKVVVTYHQHFILGLIIAAYLFSPLDRSFLGFIIHSIVIGSHKSYISLLSQFLGLGPLWYQPLIFSQVHASDHFAQVKQIVMKTKYRSRFIISYQYLYLKLSLVDFVYTNSALYVKACLYSLA